VAYIGCPDHINSVVYRIERVKEDDAQHESTP